MNHTLMALISKKSKPELISDFRPINLCNMIYKLVIKVITNRLKLLLPFVISTSQGASVQGRLISDNILIAYMQGDFAAHGTIALKLDMSKAFDCVEWTFLAQIMLRLGFPRCWVDLVMKCVQMASFSFLINDSPRGHLLPTRGIRQGDPLSPYLFLFSSEGLSCLLSKATW